MTQRSVEAEIGLCLLFAAVDGEITERELGALSDHMGSLLGEDSDPLRLPELVEGELEAIAELGVDDYVAKLPGRIAPEHRFEAVRAACVVACADGLAPEEEDIVRQVCEVLDIDADDVIDLVGARTKTGGGTGFPEGGPASLEYTHDDHPNGETAHIRARLSARGWVDPMQALRDAGVTVSGFGALSLEYDSPTQHLLRLEHHTCDGSVHLHVTTQDAESGTDLVLSPAGRESELLDVIVAMQDDVTLENLQRQIAKLLEVSDVSILEGDALRKIVRPS